jgi:nitrite reductase/ring-hydroxylating ferredoxin subunit
MNEREPELHTIPPDRRSEHEQPQWRHDFPIDWPQDHYVARRDFTKFLCLTSLAFFVGQLVIAAANWRRRRRGEPPIREIAKTKQLAVGQAMVFHYPDESEPCLLLRTAEQSFAAFSQKCTHLACAVVPHQESGQLHCPCHNGFFDAASGRLLAGPPRRPLPQITLRIDGERIYATGVQRRTV